MSLKDINTYTALNHTIIQAITWDLINISWELTNPMGNTVIWPFPKGF
jgi:hypothetical protein